MTFGELWRRLVYIVNRGRVERELAAEMDAHRAMMADPRRFGNVLRLREESRDVWGWGWLERVPAFSVTAILILGGGIGLNLTFFNLLNVTMLKPVEVTDPATLVRLERRGRTFSSSGIPYPATQFIGRHNSVLASVLTHHG